MAILEVSLKKSYVKDVDMNYLVNVTQGFSGGDLTKICRQAYMLAKIDLMKTEQPIMDSSDEREPLLLIQREHLEKAITSGCFYHQNMNL
jgi:SpoVK/Ycf46/Vps4 family AAA+-type ATPase